MLNAEELKTEIAKLNTVEGFKLHALKFGEPIDDKIIEQIETESGGFKQIHPTLREFYKNFNGLSLEWQITNDEIDIVGSLNIFEIEKAFYGEYEISGENYIDALEDILWNTYMEDTEIKKLRPHRIFESVVGNDAFYTFNPRNNDGNIYYVSNGTIKELKIPIQDFIEFRLTTLGLAIDIAKFHSQKSVSEVLNLKEVKDFLKLIN